MIFRGVLVKYKVIKMNQIVIFFRFKFNYLLYFTALRVADYLHLGDDASQCKIKRHLIVRII